MDLSKVHKAFFVGIGGIGISAIARMMILEGKAVSGSDIAENEMVRELRSLGADIVIGQSFDLIPKDVDLVVYTIAIKHYDLPLYEKILASGVIAKSYPEMLSLVTAGKYTIAVAGTHGKTTTTAMIAKILIDAKRDPSVIVGSLLKEYKSNLIVGKSEPARMDDGRPGGYFVVEACEYERSFLNINPTILVITNIEADHLDYYKDLADIENAFAQLVGQTKSVVICNPADISTAVLVQQYTGKIVDYTECLDRVPTLAVPGKHNRLDAACALAVADVLGINELESKKALQSFAGTWRRLDKRGATKNGTIIYDDYAHHPTEIRASLEALRELYPKGAKKIHVIFQPHLYSRTKALWDEFVTAFDEADTVALLPIYFAREVPDPNVTSAKLQQAIQAHRGGAESLEDFAQADQYVLGLNLGENDVLVTMGAGEAYKVGDVLLTV